MVQRKRSAAPDALVDLPLFVCRVQRVTWMPSSRGCRKNLDMWIRVLLIFVSFFLLGKMSTLETDVQRAESALMMLKLGTQKANNTVQVVWGLGPCVCRLLVAFCLCLWTLLRLPHAWIMGIVSFRAGGGGLGALS